MFTELDGNDDSNLDEDELNSVENDPYEICLRPFLDRCDQDANDMINLDEWCDCFTYAGKGKLREIYIFIRFTVMCCANY